MAKDRNPQPLRVTTRRGDSGETDLLFGVRVRKTHRQIQALGAIDELNAAIGLAKAFSQHKYHLRILRDVQKDLVILMGEVACPTEKEEEYQKSSFQKFQDSSLDCLDAHVSHLESLSLTGPGWAAPGEGRDAAFLDQARTFARRAERQLLALSEDDVKPIRPLLLQYFNRLSDLLWLMARQAER